MADSLRDGSSMRFARGARWRKRFVKENGRRFQLVPVPRLATDVRSGCSGDLGGRSFDGGFE